jgi:putative transposase
MAVYSLDLRKRIFDATERGLGTRSEIANLFGIHESFVYKLLRQKRERGDIAPLLHGGGAQTKLSEDHLMILTDLVSKTPDATLEELREQIKKRARVEVSIATIWRASVATTRQAVWAYGKPLLAESSSKPVRPAVIFSKTKIG